MHLFGDSFSAYQKGWPKQIGVVSNHATRGASEYRIYRTYNNAKPDSQVIFVHTHWSRLFLKDTETFNSRLLSSHRWADILVNDLLRNESHVVEACNTIWDDKFLSDTYWLYVDKLLDIPNSFHFTFFSDIVHPQIHNLNKFWEEYPGDRTTNHLSIEGNALVANHILDIIK